MEVNELYKLVETGKLKKHHEASRRGYISRKHGEKVEDYDGRFGTGYVVISPRWDTTQYVDITYYIDK